MPGAWLLSAAGRASGHFSPAQLERPLWLTKEGAQAR